MPRWRNWQTHTLQVRTRQLVWVQVPPAAQFGRLIASNSAGSSQAIRQTNFKHLDKSTERHQLSPNFEFKISMTINLAKRDITR